MNYSWWKHCLFQYFSFLIAPDIHVFIFSARPVLSPLAHNGRNWKSTKRNAFHTLLKQSKQFEMNQNTISLQHDKEAFYIK